MAGKLHAILTRRFTKGRDLYDLAWYLMDPEWPSPNIVQLNNALRQTGWDGKLITSDNWRAVIKTKLSTVDWPQAVPDVSPFLERRQDITFVSKEALFPLLDKNRAATGQTSEP